jgi:hypothetical protein
MNVAQVQSWLHWIKTFEQVNWDVDMPNYSVVEALGDPDFMWEWMHSCIEQYNVVVQVTGAVYATQDFPPRSEVILQPVLIPTQRTFNPANFGTQACEHPISTGTGKAQAS